MTLFVQGMQGLGDNVYQRAFLSGLKQPFYLETPWPELYRDTAAMPVMPLTRLRTQIKNVKRQTATPWCIPHGVTRIARVKYGSTGIFAGMHETLQTARVPLNLPSFGDRPIPQKYAIVRPVTIRAEWEAHSRNPLPEYVDRAAKALSEAGYTIVSVADLEKGKEWSLGTLPYADITFHNGELSVTELMRYAEHAGAIVGGIGWIAPVAQAYRRPALLICGGNGGYNSPSMITDDKIDLDKHHIRFAVPDNFCLCTDKNHECDKRISNYDNILRDWIADLG
jgi:hypothetical protein